MKHTFLTLDDEEYETEITTVYDDGLLKIEFAHFINNECDDLYLYCMGDERGFLHPVCGTYIIEKLKSCINNCVTNPNQWIVETPTGCVPS